MLASALHVSRNAKVGFGLAAGMTALLLVVFVAPGTTRPPYLYGALAFVFLVSLGGLLTAVFTAFSAVRLARQ
jgi:uncharacterized membrane protein YedE/YeeE